ncbi:MAG: transcription antitermination factor NusB [Planctomycetes bacterium]|nr:transcription antitermination factor NusB [Planctomycetota bacterium]
MTDTGARRGNAARSRGRSLAVHTLYSFEQNRYRDDDVALLPDETTADYDADAQAFARSLFDGFRRERAAVDAAVDSRLENWTIQRLAVLDRTILRLGAYELLYCSDTPAKVAINEYIELSKLYGSEAKTARLVNGVLDRIAREHRADEVGKRGAKRPASGDVDG